MSETRDENTGGPVPCPRCKGKTMHYANCPDRGDWFYTIRSLTLDGEPVPQPTVRLASAPLPPPPERGR